MRVVLFGDSITDGYAGVSYVEKVQGRIREQLNLEPTMVNMGRAGDGIKDLAWRVERARPPEDKFHWAVLGIGVNDVYYNGSLAGETGFIDTYRDLLELILASWAEKVLAFPPLLAGDQVDDPGNWTVTRLAGKIEQLVQKYRQAEFLDLHRLFLGELAKGRILTLDGVHLNQAGAALLAENLVIQLLDRSQKQRKY